MSIVLEINNPNILEKKLFDFAIKDPKKHSRIINREYKIEDVDDFALGHIEDSGKYIHDFRRKKILNF